MNRSLSRSAVAGVVAVGFCVALVHCGDDDSGGPGLKLDGIDSSFPTTDSAPGPAVDSGSDDDAKAIVEAGSDAGDGGAGIDAAPRYDDAGCSIPSDPLPNLADAGFPTTGLILWLRADRGVSTTDAGGVCRWNDQSGKGHSFDVSEPGGSFTARPKATPDAINNKPGISVTGTTSQIHRDDTLGLPANSARTYVAFGATSDTTRRFNYLFQATPVSDNVSYAGFDMNTYLSSPAKEGVYMTANAYEANVATTTSPRVHVYAVDDMTAGASITANIHYDVDGTATTLAHTPGGVGNNTFLDFKAATQTFVGLAPGTDFTGAAVGEVMLFDRSLSATERTAINAYFQARYPKP